MNILEKIFGTKKEAQIETIVDETNKEFNFNDYLDENFTWLDHKRPIKVSKLELCTEEIVDGKLKKKYKMVTYKTRREVSHNYSNEDFTVIINKHGLTVWDIKHDYLRIYKMPIPKTREEADVIFSKLK